MYLIWSNEHRAWWRAKSSGYTMHLEAAGHYTREEALAICNGRDGWCAHVTPDEIPVLASDVAECSAVHAARVARSLQPQQ